VPVDAMHNGVFPGYLVQFALTSEAAKCVARRLPKKRSLNHTSDLTHTPHTHRTHPHTHQIQARWI
jgi:hypothetical protein